jgi:hypothetical protein
MFVHGPTLAILVALEKNAKQKKTKNVQSHVTQQ